MKKAFSILIAAVLLLALAAAPAFAERTPRFFLTGPSSVKVGDQFKVQLNLEGDFSVNIINIRVRFDPAAIRFVSDSYGSASFGTSSSGVTVDGNEYSYGAMLVTGTSSAEGVLSEITFEVLSSAPSSFQLAIDVREFEYLDMFSATATPVACESTGLTIAVSDGTGAGTTPIPGPGDPTPDPNEGGKTNPDNTPDPAQPIETASVTDPTQQAVEVVTPDPNEGGNTDPNTAKTTQPAGEPTDEPGGTTPSRISPALKKGLIIGGGALAAILLAVVILVIVRAAKEKKNR